jgi:hypothetical protein
MNNNLSDFENQSKSRATPTSQKIPPNLPPMLPSTYSALELEMSENPFVDPSMVNSGSKFTVSNFNPTLDDYSLLQAKSQNFNGVNGLNAPFDSLASRRHLLSDISFNNVVRAQHLLAEPATRNSMQFFNGTLDSSRLNYHDMPLVYQMSARQPTYRQDSIASENMEDLINVMARRRVAVKRLENDIINSHRRAYTDSNMLQSTHNLRSDAYDNLERQASLRNARLSSRHIGNGYGLTAQTPAARLLRDSILDSNLEFPSDTNREIYSTYLVDSVRPHLSAHRMINGKSTSGNNMAQLHQRQPTHYDNSGDQARVLNKRNPNQKEKLADDYEFVI